MRATDLEKLKLMKWDGSHAFINKYSDAHDQLTLGLARSREEKDQIGISFFYCTHVAGPVRWANAHLRVQPFKSNEGDEGFEVCDERAGFLVRCLDTIVVGDNELVASPR